MGLTTLSMSENGVCTEVRGMRESEVPSINLVGRSMRQFPHLHRVSPINKVFYNVRPA